MNATHDSLVKFDRRGRLRYAPEQKAALVEAYAASGLSGPKLRAQKMSVPQKREMFQVFQGSVLEF